MTVIPLKSDWSGWAGEAAANRPEGRLDASGPSAQSAGGVAAFSTPAVAARPPQVDGVRKRARLLAQLERHGQGWFWECDAKGTLTYISPHVARLLAARGFTAEGANIADIFQAAQLDSFGQSLTRHLDTADTFSDVEVRLSGLAEQMTWLLTGYACHDRDKRFCGFVGTGTDLAHAGPARAAKDVALLDALTGLANRTRMDNILTGIFSSGRGRYSAATLMMVDLDRFKQVNDTFGHPVGDELLRQVAERLKLAVGDAGVVARFGGDEFQVLLPDETRHDVILRLAKRIIRGLSRSFQLADQSVTIGGSVGIAIAPEHATGPEDLLRHADLALYSAKSIGPNQVALYQTSMRDAARDKKLIEEDLRNAIARGELSLVYQPIVRAADEHIAGYEALLRWAHPERGMVSPAAFIPIAEECGLIASIGSWVLEQACAAAQTWPNAFRLAVNVSASQIIDPRFADIVQDTLKTTGLAAHRLELEITESVLLQSQKEAEATFARLAAMGVGLALDDFGTGYCSLTYLKNAPCRKIKIDQSFVRDGRDPDSKDRAIISAVTGLARSLGIETVAEGVEEEQDLALVRSLNVTYIQGFIYGRHRTTEQILKHDKPSQPLKRKRPARKAERAALVR